uniref:Histone H1 n=1 Tax=Strongyloides venezuelensis TaxID=75913 RepID=A0A0K0F022_STRVS
MVSFFTNTLLATVFFVFTTSHLNAEKPSDTLLSSLLKSNKNGELNILNIANDLSHKKDHKSAKPAIKKKDESKKEAGKKKPSLKKKANKKKPASKKGAGKKAAKKVKPAPKKPKTKGGAKTTAEPDVETTTEASK